MNNRWHKLVANLNTWRRQGQRAVHKPLLTLLILGRAQRGEPREIPYAELHDKLDQGLRLFGPQRGLYHPEYPFWHLQGDDFWIVQDAEDLARFPRRKGKDRPKSAKVLLDGNAVGEVKREYWDELLENPQLVKQLGLQLLNEFWPPSYHAAVADHCGLDLRPGQDTAPQSRREIFATYNGTCAICRYKGLFSEVFVGTDVAYIHFLEQGGPDRIPNGLVLCALHQSAFVWGILGITETLTIQVSSQLCEPVPHLLELVDSRLLLPAQPEHRPSAEHITWHHENVFRGPPLDR